MEHSAQKGLQCNSTVLLIFLFLHRPSWAAVAVCFRLYRLCVRAAPRRSILRVTRRQLPWNFTFHYLFGCQSILSDFLAIFLITVINSLLNHSKYATLPNVFRSTVIAVKHVTSAETSILPNGLLLYVTLCSRPLGIISNIIL